MSWDICNQGTVYIRHAIQPNTHTHTHTHTEYHKYLVEREVTELLALEGSELTLASRGRGWRGKTNLKKRTRWLDITSIAVDGLPVTGAAVSLRRVEGLELLFHIFAARGWC